MSRPTDRSAWPQLGEPSREMDFRRIAIAASWALAPVVLLVVGMLAVLP